MDKGTKKFLYFVAVIGGTMWLLDQKLWQSFLGGLIGVFGMFFTCYFIFYRGVLGGESGPFFGSLRDDDE